MTAKPPIPVAELREAALLAEGLLLLESARYYGLVTGGPEVDVERCEATIARAREHGVEYGKDDVDAAVAAIVAELGRPPEAGERCGP